MKINRICLILCVLVLFLVVISCSANNSEDIAVSIDEKNDTIQDSDANIILTVEINPSVKLSLDSDQIVIAYKALNTDAESLVINSTVGLDAASAVELILIEARSAGFLTEDELNEDYVLLTSVPMKGNSEDIDNLGQRIKSHIQNSEDLKSVNVAMIKATKIELREANNKKVPVGLYVINGSMSIDGESVSVKEYFSKNKNIEKFKQNGEIVEKSNEKRFEQIEKYLERLESQGFEINQFKERLYQTDLDVKSLSKEIRDYVKENRKSNKGNGKPKGN